MHWNGKGEGHRDGSREERCGDHYLPTISLILVPHPKTPNLYQRCFEYSEPWQWSQETELVETRQWVVADPRSSLLRRGRA